MNKYKKAIIIALWSLFGIGVITVIYIFAVISAGRADLIPFVSDGDFLNIPKVEDIMNPKSNLASEIYSEDGVLMGHYFKGNEDRVAVPFDSISPFMTQALIATEDVRFYEHSGIDFKALTRAVLLRGILHRKEAGGGSTLTQQLAKQLFSPHARNTIERAIQKPVEWIIALKLERFYTKEEIIAMYLNQFDFLYNAVGINTAAKVYFNTTPDKLKIEECALLVGMCKNPSYFNPVRYSERAEGRRNTVLDQMCKYGFITEQECDSLKLLPIKLKFKQTDHKDGQAPYLREYLRRVLMAVKPVRYDYPDWQYQQYHEDSLAWETDPLYGWCNKNVKADGSHYSIYTDGLKIYTTIDTRMQRYAEEAVREYVAEYLQSKIYQERKGQKGAPFARSRHQSEKAFEESVKVTLERHKRQSERYVTLMKRGVSKDEIDEIFNTETEMTVYNGKTFVDTVMTPMDSIRLDCYFLRCGFMSMDPFNGHVKAYVGGTNFKAFQYDMVTKGKRQVGSTVKPYLYALAMEEGDTPCSMYPCVKKTYRQADGSKWTPRGGGARGGSVTLHWGLANSNNYVSAALCDKYTPQSLANIMHSFGIQSYLQPILPLCLGACEVSVKEMVSAYTTFVNKGLKVDPVYVTRIEDNTGRVLVEFTPRTKEIISEHSSYEMLMMMGSVINEGTGRRLRNVFHFHGDIAGKTGTTNESADGWFFGITPQLVSGGWVGGTDRAVRFVYSRDDKFGTYGFLGQGACMSLPIWGLYMQKVYADTSLPYSDNTKFDIPIYIKDEYTCHGASLSNIDTNDDFLVEEDE